MTVFITKAGFLNSDKDIPPHLSRELRRSDAFIRYGVLVANEILEKAGTEGRIDTENCGLFLGSSYGPMETNFEVLDQVVNREQTSPTLFSHSVFNAASGYLARIFQLQGCALTLTDFGFPFFSALQQAVISIKSGHISSCLVLQIETFSTLLDDTRNIFCKNETSQWLPGACAWLLTDKVHNSHSRRIDHLSLQTCTVPPQKYLTFREILDIDGEKISLYSPLDSAVEISKAIIDNSKKSTFTLTAPYGEMLLTTSL